MIKAEKRATIIKGINQSINQTIKESHAGCDNSPSNYYKNVIGSTDMSKQKR